MKKSDAMETEMTMMKKTFLSQHWQKNEIASGKHL